jgi:protease IV
VVLPGARKPAWGRGCLVLVAAGALFITVVTLLARPGGDFGMTPRVGLIRVEGEISEARPFLDELRRVELDGRIRALVLRVDSPGGGVGATQEMLDALQRYRRRTEHPVVASLGATAASGGYYLACAASKIVAEPGTITGSIGVIMTFTDASELMKKIGVRTEVVKTGPRKDVGAWWRPMTDDDRAMLQSVVADAYEQFTSTVAESRALGADSVRSLADGRILTGRQALKVGLVDTLGFEPDAIRMAARLAGLDPATPVSTHERREPDWFSIARRLAGRARVLLGSAPSLEYR